MQPLPLGSGLVSAHRCFSLGVNMETPSGEFKLTERSDTFG
jgi:hypothetical protein